MAECKRENLTVTEVAAKALEMRRMIIEMLTEAGSGHPGGSLSATDIMASLFFHEMNIDPKEPKMADRDRFVLCKGHAAPALYSALALKGFFPKEDVFTLRKLGSHLQGHPDMKKLLGVDVSTGSLGQGLSMASGMALAGKLDNAPYRVYAILGDGELEEGQVWEAAMFAAHYHLDNLCAFVDNNGLQIDGNIDCVMSPNPIADKWRAFGWHVIEINGHDVQEIFMALDQAKTVKEQPTMIVAHTVKGKGVSFMENQAVWHGAAPKPDEKDRALAELV
ncbi:MAG: transketolase [Peptococcaceae bacterium]|jgi:transketolase|nr:transketolase [Peptococcaceae bacterium]